MGAYRGAVRIPKRDDAQKVFETNLRRILGEGKTRRRLEEAPNGGIPLPRGEG